MSRKGLSEPFATKPSRNDRFAQMSRQEQVIEQKKREIQARLQQQKEKTTTVSTSTTKPTASVDTKKTTKPIWKGNLGSKPSQNANNKPTAQFNMFSNDGSFLDQFKQMNDTKKNFDQKITISSIKSDKVRDNSDRSYSDERNKPSRWSKSRPQSQGSYTIPEDASSVKNKMSRFSDPPPETPAQQMVTSYAPTFSSADLYSNNFGVQPPIVVQTTAPVLVPPPLQTTNPQMNSFPVVTSAAPLLVPPPLTVPGVPPPQIVPSVEMPMNKVNALIAPPPPHTSLTNQPMTGGGITVPPPVLSVQSVSLSVPRNTPCLELTSIPAPTPIPVHAIPQPEPLNALTIPPPAPLQLQNIPSPSPIRLNEIPNPKPIDLMKIPAPGEEQKIGKMTDPEFIKNVPPPNKSVPPPNLGTVTVSELPNVTVPPPNATATVIPPTSVPPPLHPHHGNQQLPQPLQSLQQQQHPPPQVLGAVSSANIPSLMAQPVMPPPGMASGGPPPPPLPINVSQPVVNMIPPMNLTVPTLPGPPPVLNQPPPLAQRNQLPPMTFPPPLGPPPVPVGHVAPPPPGIDINTVCPAGSASHDAMVSLGRMVAQCGSGIEDIVQQRSAQDPSLWFLFHKNSAAYQQYRQLVEQFRADLGPTHLNSKKQQQQHHLELLEQQLSENSKNEYQPEDIYEPENVTDDEHQQPDSRNMSHEQDSMSDSMTLTEMACMNSKDRKRKRKSRWGEKVLDTAPSLITPPVSSMATLSKGNASQSPMLSKITRNDPGLIQYAVNTFGSTNLTEEEWRKAEDHYKINLLYQVMVRKRQEVERLKRAGKNKYEYDSDEETDGGTWEHKLRMQEMEATQMWANELTRQAEGKHHIGDFLPPDELKKFMEKYSAAKEGRQPNLSDYKEFKLKEDNIGFKMLQKLGWQEGQGLGSEGTGIVEPVNKASVRDQNQGLGLQQPDGVGNTDDEYDAYRKRMMLAYRFRPNPLNNPRRPYY